MDSLTANDVTLKNGETTHYYEGGSQDGIPLIFIHGWPDIAESWKHQLSHFTSSRRYRVIALDMRGYGGSSAPSTTSAYSLGVLAPELAEFASILGIQKAIWIGHDWGCAVLNALAAHYPELFLGLANLCVPYRTVELGLDFLKSTINRDIYPEEEYEWGQFDYMRYYELHPEECIKSYESNVEVVTKVLYAKADPEQFGKPGPTSRISKQGGFFGGHPEKVPDIPLAYTSLDEHLLASLVKSHKKHGFFGATSYYLNHGLNAKYAENEKNGGVLEFPVLYIDGKYDSVCSATTTPKMGESQRAATKDLTFEKIEAGHWVHLEKPEETNEKLEKWLSRF